MNRGTATRTAVSHAVLAALVVFAGCLGGSTPVEVGNDADRTTTITVETGNDTGPAAVHLAASENVSVELLVYHGAGDDAGDPAIVFHRTLTLDAGEEYRITIPAIPDSNELDRAEDELEIRTGNGTLTHAISSCTVYRITASTDEMTLDGTGRVSPSDDYATARNTTAGVGTSSDPDECLDD